MWQHLYQVEAEVPDRDMVAEIEAGELDERWLIRGAQARENSLEARLMRMIKRVRSSERRPERTGLRRLEPRSSL